MKKLIFTFLVVSLFTSYLNSFAGERVILLERFTSSTCGPCATNNPTLQTFLNEQDPDKIISLAWHMNWPSPGNDPMYAYNVEDNTARRTFFAVNSIPRAFMDGVITIVPNYSIGALMSAYFTRIDILSPITLVVRDSVAGDQLFTKVTFYCETALPVYDLNMRIIIGEKDITYPSPPGTNGERIFTDVSRRGLPSANGTDLTIAPYQVYNYTYQTTIDPLWQPEQRKTVVFVESNSTKEVLNAATTLSNFAILPVQGVKTVPTGVARSATFDISVPYFVAGYNSPVTFSAELMGNYPGVSVALNSATVLSNFPGSIPVTVSSTASVGTGIYKIIVYATNAEGKMHKTVVNYIVDNSSGVHNIGTEVPAEFSLFQNFPNPFNPETKIRFDIPKAAYTSIKIYDNLGKEISQLVNQSLAAGRYEYELNASNFATGVYYYEIQAGEFRQIKKMMVVK